MTSLLIFVILIFLGTFILVRVLKGKKAQFVLYIVGLMGIAYQLVINRHESFWSLGFSLSYPAIYLQGSLAVCAILALILAIGNIAGKLSFNKGKDGKKQFVLFGKLFIYNTVIAIFTEELVFRGCIQRQFMQYMPPVYAILAASALFGLWHVPFGRDFKLNKYRSIMYPVGAGLAGLMLGVFYYKSQSLIVAGFLHGLWNAIVYAVWGVGDKISGLFEDRAEALTHPEYGLIGIATLLISVVLLLVFYL